QDWLQVDCAGYVMTGAAITVSAGDVEKDLVLHRGVRVEGVVLDVDGKPVRGAEIWIGEGRHYADMQTGLSHDDGSFAFEHVATGPRKVGCEKKASPPVELDVTVPADRDRLDGVTLRLSAAHFLAGKVVDRDGHGVAGANVMYCRDPSSYEG